MGKYVFVAHSYICLETGLAEEQSSLLAPRTPGFAEAAVQPGDNERNWLVGLIRGRDGQPLRIRDPGLVKTGGFHRGSETHKCRRTARSPVHLRPSCSQCVMGPDYLKNFGPFYHHGGTQDLTLICHMRLDNFAKLLQLRLSRIMALIHHAACNCSPLSHHHPGS